ncbi:MAG: DUF4921 family protein [Planctomycetales bacterium]|nr:DUF4921 family protein [Planctomycetales bacterium]
MSYQREDATSTEMRHDWLLDRWVIMAPERTSRPDDFERKSVKVVQQVEDCPFCQGHEYETPSALAEYSVAKSSGTWQVRVVPNKFPAVRANAAFVQSASCDLLSDCVMGDGVEMTSEIDLFQKRNLSGGHEVIVESPRHLSSMTQLDREAMYLVFEAYRDRLARWLEHDDAEYAVVFKNVGPDAGASLIHTHSQLIATDVLPTDIARSTARMQLFYEREGECLFCRTIQDEVQLQNRVVECTDDFLVYCPFASRLPSLVTIVPRTHQSQFEMLDGAPLEHLAWLTHRTIRRIEKCFPEAAYNLVIHTSPRFLKGSSIFHWRIELFPRITKIAGFEWGSDCFINPIPPEIAAPRLRHILV